MALGVIRFPTSGYHYPYPTRLIYNATRNTCDLEKNIKREMQAALH